MDEFFPLLTKTSTHAVDVQTMTGMDARATEDVECRLPTQTASGRWI